MLLETGDGYGHLIVWRFDGPGGERLHQHTLGGLLRVDYNEPGASSYEEYLRPRLRLGMSPADVVEGRRRMVFNVLAVNQDDPVKNLSCHMDRPVGKRRHACAELRLSRPLPAWPRP
jgi:serine/threonine-protein kinase HipA